MTSPSPTPYLRLILGVCILAQCAYVLSFSPFPTADASTHLASATAMVDYVRGGAWARANLEWRLWPVPPNLLPGIVLAALTYVIGAVRAEYVLIVGYVAALPCAMLWAIRRVRPESSWLALLAVPLTMSHALLYGFFNFAWSLVLLVVFAGLVLERNARLTTPRSALFYALLLMLYGTHLVGWFAGCALFGTVVLSQLLAEQRDRAKTLGLAALAVAPTLIMAALFVLGSRSGSRDALLNPLPKFARIGLLEYGQSAYQRSESPAFAVLGLLFWALLLRSAWRTGWRALVPSPALGLALATAALWLLGALGPEGAQSGAAFLPQRIASIVALFAVLLLAVVGVRAREAAAAAAVAVVVALFVNVVRLEPLQRAESYQRAMLDLAAHVEPGSSILQANAGLPDIGDGSRIRLLTGDSGRLAVAVGGYELANVDLALPYWPLRFRAEMAPRRWLVAPGHDIEDMPPPLSIGAYEANVPATVDYVLLAGRSVADADVLASEQWRAFDGQLRRGFAPTAKSPDGFWELWAAKRTQAVAR